MDARTARTLGFLSGILLAGYGALIVLRLLAHESLLVGTLLLACGGALALVSRPRAQRETPSAPDDARAGEAAPSPAAQRGRMLATVGLGATSAVGVLAYNAMARSDLSVPELAVLGYGLALLAAAPFLTRRVGPTNVGTLVAWSLPLFAAPLAMYALDAALDATAGSSPLDAFIRHGLVAPMTASLTLLGFEAKSVGQTVLLGTPRGTLSLTVGVVCAGFQPGVLFLGVLGLHAWREQTPPKRLALYLALGLMGVYAANVIRLVALALVGHQWGGAALTTAHAHFGWILFVGWMLLFWGVVLRRLEGRGSAAG